MTTAILLGVIAASLVLPLYGPRDVRVEGVPGTRSLSSPPTRLFALTATCIYGSRLFAKELRPRGVLVNAISPGWVRTDMGGRGAPRSVEQGAASVLWA
jgi:hypothetical protein